MRSTLPGWYKVKHSTHSDGETELTYIEYQTDINPADTVMESVMFYLIRTQDGLRVEQDRSLNGLFPIQTWLYVMAEAEFTV
ncbi:MAG TPA: hypothetical protein VHY08_22330 [Bacillota bacterium]|nr:hypothetical protein [Bacillota bacterium]